MREINPEQMRQLEALAREIAEALGRATDSYKAKYGKKCGFGLFLFSFEGPEFTWISNAQRADMMKTMQEFITRNPPDQVSAERN